MNKFIRRLGWQLLSLALPVALQAAESTNAPSRQGYYRFPAIHGNDIVFTAEGDLWHVGIEGGVARRLTSHPDAEFHAAFSPDGKTIAFSGQYEGPVEVYTMPLEGGLPKRQTYEGGHATVAGWTPAGKIIYSTMRFSTLPNWQLSTVDPRSDVVEVLPLSQASEGVFDPEGKTIYFTRLQFQGSHTKRYQGGTAQNLWKYTLGSPEAIPLTPDFAGTSKCPMWWQGRIYFVTDRDGAMNLWSMNTDGGDLRQLTKHKGWDAKDASQSDGHIVYQLGADLHLYDIASQTDKVIPITLTSDFDQEREKWVKRPLDYLTRFDISPDGDRVVFTARGQVFVAPVGRGRFVNATRNQNVRYREARFLPDGKSLLALSDESGELEFNKLPANGIGEPEQLTHDGKIFRFGISISPDGKWAAWQDKNQELWVMDTGKKESKRIATSKNDGFGGLNWSPDSQWLAFAQAAENDFARIMICNVKDGDTKAITDDHVNSYSPAWSRDGKWIYFISERHFQSLVASPWGLRQPEPYFNNLAKIYQVSLHKDERSPFEPDNELQKSDSDKKKDDDKKSDGKKKSKPSKTKPADSKDKKKKDGEKTDSKPEEKKDDNGVKVTIDWDGITNRVTAVPVGPGNYSDLQTGDKRLFWISRAGAGSGKMTLLTLDVNNDDPKPKTVSDDFRDYVLSYDAKKILIRRGDDFFVGDSTAVPAKTDKSADLSGWSFSLNPRDEWRQMFTESWRLMRDYFYDPNMHGVDWPAMRDKYQPLVTRVTERSELSDLIGDMVGELSALHIFVTGGDFRDGPDHIEVGTLGATLARDAAKKGYRIEHIFKTDPDYPEEESPLLKQGVDLKPGDVIQSVNGVPALSEPDIAALLRNQAGRQVLLSVLPKDKDKTRDVIVSPINLARESDMRYDEWEYTRRLEVERLGKGDIGYVHLRTMGSKDIADWTRQFYPVFNRQGLIIDVRHNGGGNIDSWILEKLLRKAWFYWQPRVGNPSWNMQYAFRGHIVVLCDERTGSDGEAFTEGFKRLGLGKVIGTRTWGGEIWLSFDNYLVDKGIASAAEIGVFGPEGKWLIEGHGVDPDMVVDNLPHRTFEGEDAQLKAAIAALQEEIRTKPIPAPKAPPHPDKSFK